MKTFNALILAAILAASVGTAVSAETAYGAAGARETSSPTLEQMLIFAIQDEYLARAEYNLIMSEMGVARPFSNIKQAEEQHIAWLQALLRTYELTVPSDEAKPVAPATLAAAFAAGVQAEVDNIAMYESFLERDLPQDVRLAFERLAAASLNHRSAFRRQVARAG